MSGGHWDYNQDRIRDMLEEVGNDRQMNKRFPTLAITVKKLARTLGDIIHDIDWDFSCDSSIDNDRKFEDESITKLKKIIGEVHAAKPILMKLKKIEDELQTLLIPKEL